MHKEKKHTSVLVAVIVLLLALTGCIAEAQVEQATQTGENYLSTDQPVGQTFVARFDGLSGIYFHLSPRDVGDGEIILHLRADSQAKQDLAISYTSVRVESITGSGIYGFFVPAQVDSNQKYYYAFLEIRGGGSVEVGNGPGDSYLDGALYQNHEPQDAQTVFRLSYSRRAAAIELFKEFLGWIGILLVSVFLYILPGWGILSVCLPRWSQLHWAEKAGLSTGLSLALYPIFFLWTDLIGLHLGAAYAWILPLLGGYLLVWNFTRQGIPLRVALGEVRGQINLQSLWSNLTLLMILGVLIFTRFWAIRGVEIPLWGDSLQHTMITQLMLENNGLFTSWQPYAPYYSLTTHFGFSTLTALFAWIIGVNGTQATLWVGQIINYLAILTLYPLATRISKGNQWAGIGALIVGGLASSLPAIYVNWGRFAQLTGQAVLPVAIWLLWEAVDDNDAKCSMRFDWTNPLLAGVVMSGMTLSYYRMPFYYATFVVVLLLFWGLPKWRLDIKCWGNSLLRLLLIGVIGIALFIPWGKSLIGGNLAASLEAGVTTGTNLAGVTKELETFTLITNYVPALLLGLVALSVIWALLRKNWLRAALPLWFLLLTGYMLAAPLKLPGANMLQGFAILIAAYLPIALLLGWSFGEIICWIEKRSSKWPLVIASLATISISLWFGWQQGQLLDLPQYALVSYPDQRAMDWIKTHTASNAIFLVQGFQYYGTAAGSDAGWWLPLLAQRANMLPPQYAQFNEVSRPPDYTQRVVELVKLLSVKPLPNPESTAALCDWGITHIYSGQGQGKIGSNATPLYSPEALRAEPELFKLIHQQDQVSIFALNPTACQK